MRRRTAPFCCGFSIAVAGLFSACDGSGSDRNSALTDLDRLERLAFVPAGTCVLSARTGPPLACSNAEALIVDRFEVSRGEWLRWYEQDPAPKDPLLVAAIEGWAPETANWPASFVTLLEARRFATSRGMRLLSAREWLRIACGTRAQPWPWGANMFNSVANTLELELARPVPVGTFEQGRTPFSIYDLLGNVWEWVEDPPFARPAEHALQSWAMGGSFLSRQRRLYELDHDGRLSLYASELDVAARSSDVGLRCAAPAEAYLRAHAAQWDEGTEGRERLIAVGRLWGREALPVLERLAADASVARSITWLLEGARR